MSLSDLMSNLKEKVNELKTEALKFKNKNFLHAAMAGSALLALADGVILPDEKKKCLNLSEIMSLYLSLKPLKLLLPSVILSLN